MAKNKNDDKGNAAENAARYHTTPEDKIKAKKWFKRARELGDKRQFDYAIEYYASGLEFWPDAVEDACKPLHGCAVARRQTGGKKPGFKDTLKRSMNDKDPKKAFVNALWLFGHEPENVAYAEGLTKCAARLRAEDTCQWAAGIFQKSLESNQKASSKQFLSLTTLLEELGDRAVERNETEFAVACFEQGVTLLSVWRNRFPNDHALEAAIKNLSTKSTITRGKYKKGESFIDSVRDKDAQKELHDEKLSMQDEDQLDTLITSAEKAHLDNPQDAGCLRRLIDLLCRSEQEDLEKRAIGHLVAQYKRTEDYGWKQSADDIRMKQLVRRVRKARKAGDADAARDAHVASLKFDLAVFKERVQRFPTDTRAKYEYGLRLFKASRFDDAIPLFQAARSNPKHRADCSLHLGRCFFHKKYHSQAISTLQGELEVYTIPDDDRAKGLMYWLARAFEDHGDLEKARETYGKILELDYNYRDVRDRLDGLPAGS